jgi:PGF-pre-PGF domain-containing protein
MKKAFILMFIILLSLRLASASTYSVCPAGCDYTNLTLALHNNTDDRVSIESSGIWTIENLTTYHINSSSAVILINSSDLVLDCGYAAFSGNGSKYAIEIANKTNITIRNCNITSYSSAIYSYNLSGLRIRSCNLSSSDYGINLQQTEDSHLSDSRVAGNAIYNILLNSVKNTTIYNLTMENPGLSDIRSSGQNTSNTIIDSGFNSSMISFFDNAELRIAWSVGFFINTTSAAQAQGMNLTLYDSYFNLISSELTDASGRVAGQNLTEYRSNATGDYYYTRYTAVAQNLTYFGSEQVNFSSKNTINLTAGFAGPRIANCSGISPRQNISWNISVPTACTGKSVQLGNDRSIYAHRNLTLQQSNLTFAPSSDGSCGLQVSEYSHLTVSGSSLSSQTNYSYTFDGNHTAAVMRIYSSWIADAGYSSSEEGIYSSPLSEFNDTVFAYSYNGLNVLHNNTNISNCTFINNSNYGLYLSAGESRIIQSNFSFNGQDGLYLDHADENNITQNYFGNNTGSGIYLDSSDSNMIYSNTILDNQWSGIELQSGSDNNSVWSNTINSSSSFYGIGIDSSQGNEFRQHNLASHSGDSVYIVSSQDNLFIDSSFNNSLSDDLQTQGSGTNYFINTTADQRNIGAGTTVNFSWYISIYVNGSDSANLSGVNVSLYFNSTLLDSRLTGSNGRTGRANITGFIESGSSMVLYSNHTISLRKSSYVGIDMSANISSSTVLGIELANQTGLMPNTSGFLRNYTDFSLESDLSDVQGAEIGASDGKIYFPGSGNFSGADLDSNLVISDNLISLDSAAVPGLNIPAMLSMLNVTCPVQTIFYSPSAGSRFDTVAGSMDCEAAGICTGKTCQDSQLTFNVTGFSSFAIGFPANLTIWDTSQNQTTEQNDTITFIANLSNASQPINGTGISCNLSHNYTGSWSASQGMAYNSSYFLYMYSTSFANYGNFSFRVSCNASALGFGPVNAEDNFTINRTDPFGPQLAIVYPQNNSYLSNSTTFAYINITTDEYATCKLSMTDISFNFTTGGTLFDMTNETLMHYYNYTGLSQNNTYTLYYKCNDTKGNINPFGTNHTFHVNETRDTTPISITNIANSSIDNQSAAISWTTDKQGTTIVKYGTISGSYSYTYSNISYVTSHAADLTGLSGGTTYYYVVNSTDSWGNTNQSPEQSFTTDATLDTAAPRITFLSHSNGSTIGNWYNFTFNVSTNEAATCTVTASMFGTTSSSTAAVMTPSSGNLTHMKRYNATADSTGLTNYFTVSCEDSSYNSAFSTIWSRLNDTTAPTITYGAPTPDDESVVNTENITIRLKIGEPSYSGYPRISWAGASNVTMTASGDYYNYSKTELSDIEYNYTVYVRDLKGNERSSSRSFTIDTVAPEIEDLAPEDGSTFRDSKGLILNVSVDEEANCTWELYLDDDEEDDGEISNIIDEEDCKDNCEDDFDDCDDSCNNDDACEDDCEDSYDDCIDTCEDHKYIHYVIFSDTFENDNDYNFIVQCSDEAGNIGELNISFAIDDQTPPKVLEIRPNGTTETDEDEVELEVDLDEDGICRYSRTSRTWDGMNGSFGSSARTRISVDIEDLEPGNYTYYILCQDESGNTISEAKEISFEYLPVEEDEHSAEYTRGFSVGRIRKDDEEDLRIRNDNFALEEIIFVVNEDQSDVDIEITKYIDTSAISLPSDDYVYQVFKIDPSGLSIKDLNKATLRFRVEKNWLTQNSVDREDIVMKRFLGGWDSINTTYINEETDYYNYEAVTNVLDLFAIVSQKKQSGDSPMTSIDEQNPTDIPGSGNNQTDAASTGGIVQTVKDNWIIFLVIVLVVGGGSAGFLLYKRSLGHPQQDTAGSPQPKRKHLVAAEKKSFSRKDLSAVAKSLSKDDDLGHFIIKELKKRKFLGVEKSISKLYEMLQGAGHDPRDIEYKLMDMGLIPPPEGYGQDAYQEQPAEEYSQEYPGQQAGTYAGLSPEDISQLDEYIKDSLQSGMQPDDIKNQLLQNGYEEPLIDERIYVVQNPANEEISMQSQESPAVPAESEVAVEEAEQQDQEDVDEQQESDEIDDSFVSEIKNYIVSLPACIRASLVSSRVIQASIDDMI